jgi:hypothetical protein
MKGFLRAIGPNPITIVDSPKIIPNNPSWIRLKNGKFKHLSIFTIEKGVKGYCNELPKVGERFTFHVKESHPSLVIETSVVLRQRVKYTENYTIKFVTQYSVYELQITPEL